MIDQTDWCYIVFQKWNVIYTILIQFPRGSELDIALSTSGLSISGPSRRDSRYGTITMIPPAQGTLLPNKSLNFAE